MRSRVSFGYKVKVKDFKYCLKQLGFSYLNSLELSFLISLEKSFIYESSK